MKFQGVLLVRFLLMGVKIGEEKAENCACLSQEMEQDRQYPVLLRLVSCGGAVRKIEEGSGKHCGKDRH